MKTIKLFSMPLLFGLFLMLSVNAHAQDPMKAASNTYKKVLLDNDQVRVMQVEIAPGEVVPWHSHPNHVVYVVADGKLELTEKGKPAVVSEMKAGDVMYVPAVTHMAKNVGTTTLKIVVTELK